ncbi:MAG: hypothetical protein AAFP89_27585 [Bacteroidota bacterium]
MQKRNYINQHPVKARRDRVYPYQTLTTSRMDMQVSTTATTRMAT